MRDVAKEKIGNRIGKEQIVDGLAFFALELFILSPVIQIVREIISPHAVSEMFGSIYTYPFTIEIINLLTIVIAIVLWMYRVVTLSEALNKKQKVKLFIPYILFAVLALWMYISQQVNGFNYAANNGDGYRNESLITFILYVLGYFFVASLLKSERLRKFLAISFLVSNLAVSVLSLVDFYIVNLRFFDDAEGMAAIFHQFNHFGYYLMIGILLAAGWFVLEGGSLILRILCGLVFIVNNVALILNSTFGCYLAVIAALVFCVVVLVIARRNRGEVLRAIALIAAFAVITVVMHFANHSTSGDMSKLVNDIGNITSDSEAAQYAGTGRWTLWTETVKCIKEKPLFGWGVEGVKDRLDMATRGMNNRPHNEYLQWAAFFGIPAGLLYLAALCVIMFGMFPKLKKVDGVSFACFIAAAGYIASAFVGNTMYYTAPFFFIFLGMSCKNRVHAEESIVTVTEQEKTKNDIAE